MKVLKHIGGSIMYFDKIGCRWVVAFMIFSNTYVNYMLRVNISVNLVAMVPTTNATYDHSQVTLEWTPLQRAQILSSYFWGYLASNSFGGLIAEQYGPRLVALIVITISALLTMLSPVAAKNSYITMLIVRIMIGFCSGFLYPSMYTLIGSWAVPIERGKFLGGLIGGAIGTFVTWSLCGVIVESFGWEWGFYTFGIASFLWCVPWWYLTYDSPDKHPRITLKERTYINEGTKISKKSKRFPPYARILTSLPAWSLLISNFGTGWGIYFVITAAPNYLSSALGYKLSSTGALSGIIYLFRSTACFVFGSAGDILLKRNILSLALLRRLATVGSHIIPGCLLMVMAIPGYSAIVYVVLIILAFTINGFVTVSSSANAYDLTSNFVGAISSILVAMSTAAGIISPFITAYFTKYNETSAEAWRPVFYTGSLVYILTGLQFIIFGSTKKQPWDEIKEIDEHEENSKKVYPLAQFYLKSVQNSIKFILSAICSGEVPNLVTPVELHDFKTFLLQKKEFNLNTDKIGCRWVIALMIFSNACINYMMRANISVNLVAMVPTSNLTSNHSQVTLNWTPFQRAHILSGYFWGYLPSNAFAGVIAERFGSRLVALVMVAVSALLTVLSPIAAKHSYITMLIVRIMIGFCSGFLYPAIYLLIGYWAVPTERGKFLGAATGGAIGTFITWALCGVIIESLGWEWGFYTFGIVAFLWCAPWWYFTYDSPDKHPTITLEEMIYINEGTKKSEKTKLLPPYGKMLTSLSIWSLLIANFGTGWGVYFVITAAPNYLSNALGYNISATGALSGIIYLFRSTACFVFGSVGDFMLKKKLLSLPVLRRLATVGSHIIPGCLLMCLAIPGYSPIIYVVFITSALTLNGHVSLSSHANSYDLTSNFVGAVTSLAVASMTAAGIISPFVTAYFTKYNETSAEVWKPVFYTGSVVYILTGLQFIIFGSTEKQHWDQVEQTQKEKDEL